MIKPWRKFFEAADDKELTKEMVSFFFNIGHNSVPNSQLGFTTKFMDDYGVFEEEQEDEVEYWFDELKADSNMRESFLKEYEKLLQIWGDRPKPDEVYERATNLTDEGWSCGFTIERGGWLIEFKKEEVSFESYISFLGKLNILADKLKRMTSREVYVHSSEYHVNFDTEGKIFIE